MPVTVTTLTTIKQLLNLMPHRPLKMISAGYPDMLVSPTHIKTLFGPAIAASLKFRQDFESILGWHGLTGQLDRVIETLHVFSLIGIELSVLDIQRVRGDEILQDLNTPVAASLRGAFDIVFDGGTMEHCFNVGQAITNFLDMAKVGGYIFHSNPFNIPNHGFYNFNPTFYADFYADNGHVLVSQISAQVGSLLRPDHIELPSTDRFQSELPECSLTVVVQKRNDNAVVWPMQTKYKKHPTLT